MERQAQHKNSRSEDGNKKRDEIVIYQRGIEKHAPFLKKNQLGSTVEQGNHRQQMDQKHARP